MSGLMKWLRPLSGRRAQDWRWPLSGPLTASGSIAGSAAHIALQGATAMLVVPHALQSMTGFCTLIACVPSASTGMAMDAKLCPPASNATSSRSEISFLAVERCTRRTMIKGLAARKNQRWRAWRLAGS